ncbi:MAG: DMT family transporter [Acetobacteraceae bacterium]|nr:DMT family transporter [Acetobacteraceae bacterium]
MTPALAGLRYLAVSVLLFGGLWPVTKHAFAHATPLWFALNRAGLAALVSATLLAALGRLRLPRRADLPAVVAIGLLQLGGFFALTHLALDFVPAGRTAILSNVTVFWLVPLSVLALGERVSPRQWAAAAVGLLGVLALMAPWGAWGGAGDAGGGAQPGLLAGYALLLGASFAWSVAILVTRRSPPQRPVLELLPWCFGLGALMILPLALLREPAGGIGREAWPHAAFVGAVAAPIGTWATIEAGRRLSGVVASLGFLAIPAFGVALSSLWLGEPLGWDVLLGSALILGSVAVAARGA